MARNGRGHERVDLQKEGKCSVEIMKGLMMKNMLGFSLNCSRVIVLINVLPVYPYLIICNMKLSLFAAIYLKGTLHPM
jgi:hypothetical protein